MLVLESEGPRPAAERRRAPFLLGYGSACDAHHLTAPHPDGAGCEAAVAEALASGGDPGRAGFRQRPRHRHARTTTGSRDGCLGDLLPGVPYHSTKGYTGHALGAAGAIEAVFTASFLEIGKIPASAGLRDGGPGDRERPGPGGDGDPRDRGPLGIARVRR